MRLSMKKKVLVLCPEQNAKGGVAFYYSLIQRYFTSERLSLEFYHTGSGPNNGFKNNRFLKSLFDILHLIRKIPDYDLIVLNPSLDAKSIIRDGTYNFISKKIFTKKTLILFHGWNRKTENYIGFMGKGLFRYFFYCDKLLVLAKQFRSVLIEWGYSPDKIGLETTIYEHLHANTAKDPYKIIFLSRFAEGKGALEAIQTVEILAKMFPKIKLYMSGDGPLDSKLKEYVTNHKLDKNIEFTGWIDGQKKYDLLQQCGIMLFPTNYGEGMPICVIEGMGMGLAIITRPVAGLADIIKNGINGYLVESIEPEAFADIIRGLFNNKNLWENISRNNEELAKRKFEVKAAVKRLEKTYFELIQ